jgi:DNA-binding IclR family transcriptional regulator
MCASPDNLKTPSLPSVPRALKVLEQIAGSQNGLNLTQLTRTLGYPRSTLHCLLVTLERVGYVRRASARGRYQCGSKLLELSGKVLACSSLREIAMPVLRALLRKTRLTVHMAVLERNQVTIIAQLAPAGNPLTTTLGQRLEVHSTALGKAIAAHLNEARLTEIMSARALPAHNERTIVSPRRFRDELAATRQRGYAIDDEEDTIGIRCLAAPVLSDDKNPPISISLMGTTLQISESNASALAAELIHAANTIADLLREHSDEGQEHTAAKTRCV